MKVILSRKGVDSTAGGKASYITNGNNLIWIPIPETDPVCHQTTYVKIQTMFGALGGVVGRLKIKQNGAKVTLPPNSKAHLDPDLCYDSLPRNGGLWVAAFGQRTAAAVNVLDKYVESGDLFLFYGWFRDACASFPRPRTARGTDSYYAAKGRSFHVIFGYLQVKECYKGKDTEAIKAALPGLSDHPHLNDPRIGNPDNRLYIATDRLKIDGLCKELPGAGVFEFDQGRCLTAPGERRRSHWRLHGWRKNNYFRPNFHRDSGAFLKWTPYGAYDWDVINHGYGQEFVIDTKTHRDVLSWVVDLFSVP